MRFVDSWLRGVAAPVALVFATATGCAVLTGPEAPATQPAPAAAKAPEKEAAKPAAASSTAQAKADAKTPPPAPAPAQAEAAPPVDVEAPVSAQIQRAFEAGRQALIRGNLDEAERTFLALTKSNPELGGPHANLGVVYRQKQKFEESVASLEKAVKASPKNAIYANQLGISYRMAGQFTKAKEAYEKAIALDPNYALAHLNLGILYDVYLWDSKKALELYDRYLTLSPSGDERVKKWATDLRNRNQAPRSLASRKEQG